MKDLSGKVAVVTGAGSGIGRALAMHLAESGCLLAVADIDDETLQRTTAMVRKSGARCFSQVVDVANEPAVSRFAAAVVGEFGAVHLLINNAGVSAVDRADDLSYTDFQWVMNVNFWGVVHGCKAFIPYLRQSGEGHIVNISSVFGLIAFPRQSAYNASKFAVRGFTEALRIELKGSAIGISCVHPGGIKTNIARNSRIGELAENVTRESLVADFDAVARTSPEIAAAIIVRGVRRNKRRVLVGFDARVIDIVSRVFPGSYEKILRLDRKMPGKQ